MQLICTDCYKYLTNLGETRPSGMAAFKCAVCDKKTRSAFGVCCSEQDVYDIKETVNQQLYLKFETQQLADGAALREAAIAAAEHSSGENWQQLVSNAIRTVALANETFTTDQVWSVVGKSRGVDSRAMGPAMRRAENLGYVAQTLDTSLTREKEAHCRPKRIWQSRIYNGSMRPKCYKHGESPCPECP